MHRLSFALIVVALALSVGISACAGLGQPAPATGQEPIKIGYIVSASGVAAADGLRDSNGAKVAVNEINKAGGVLGRPLSLVVRDDQTDAQVAGRQARELLANEKPFLLAGGNPSGSAASISALAKEQKVPYIITTAAAASLTEENGHRYVFRSWANTRTMGGTLASFAAKQPWQRFVVLFADFSFGQEVKNAFIETLKRENPKAEIAEEIAVKYGELEYTPYINKIIAAKPDAVYLAGVYGTGGTAFVKQAVPAGLYDKAVTMGFVNQDDLLTLGNLVPQGRFFGYNAFYSTVDDPWAKTFSAQFYNDTGTVADGSAFTGYMTIKWIEAALKKAGKVDGEAFVDALEGLQLDTFLGKVTMRKADHQATGDYWYGTVTQGQPPTMTGLGHFSGASYQLAEDAIPGKRAPKK